VTLAFERRRLTPVRLERATPIMRNSSNIADEWRRERRMSVGTIDDVARAGRITVFDLFRAAARRDPRRIAIHSAAGVVIFSELFERVARLAAALAAQGVARGERIAIVSENRQEYVEYELAAAALGAILACQNWRLAPAELQYCVRLVEPRLVIASQRFATRVRGLDLAGAPVAIIEETHERWIAEAAAMEAFPDVDPEDGLVILYTSGTTGLPKGALISHRAMIARDLLLRVDLHARADDGFVAWAPLFHMASTDQTVGAMISGACVHIVDGMDPEAILAACERDSIGWLVMMPGAIEPMLALLRASGRRPKCVRAMGAMADLVPAHQLAELTRLMGAPYLNSFGATETGLAPCSGALIAPGVVPASLAKRKSGFCDFRLIDTQGRDVPDGEPGEAAVRGPTVFSGYWNAPETNARDFSGGWFRMGDLFRRTPEGLYDFVDRAKYMIKSGGENIYPAEIERVLLADPRVAEAAVVRAKDARWGETPVAFVARRDDSLTGAEVEALCRAALAGYKRPREVRFIPFEAFPRSATGKITRHELEARLKEETARQGATDEKS
jgi:fatty-acyl-CoA synthase